MQFTSTTLIAILSAIAAASPIEPRQNNTMPPERLCTSAIDTAMCCQTTLAGVINQTCTTPGITPRTKQEFRKYCADQGQDSSCCKTPLVGDGIICTPP